MKSSLKDLAKRATAPADQSTAPANDTQAATTEQRSYRTAQTRSDTRQVSGHFQAGGVADLAPDSG
jgi:hypothetical protein